MKKSLLAVIFGCLLINTSGQRGKIDSLLARVNDGADSTQVLVRIALSELYRNYSNDTSQLYAREALDFARKNQFKYGEAVAHNALGYNQYVAANYDQAIKEFQQYKEIALSLGDHLSAGSAINNIGNVYIELGNYSKALGYYLDALSERKTAGNKLNIAKSYNNIGYLYKEIGEYDKGIGNIITALKIFEELKDDNGIAYCYTFLGVIYGLKRNFPMALKYHTQALGIEQMRNDKNQEGVSLQSIATIYSEQNNFEEALNYYTKAGLIYKMIGDKRQIASISESAGLLYFRMQDYDHALSSFKKALAINRFIGNTRGLSSNYINTGNCYLKKKKFVPAAMYFDSAMHYAMETGKKEDLKNLYKSKSDLSFETGDYRKAFINFQLYSAIKDSLFNIENSKAISGIQTKYETEKKERQIQEQKFQLATKNYWIAAILILLILVTLLAFSYYKRFKLKQERRLQYAILKQQDLATRSIIEAEENERKRIAGDLHDGVGQLMSAAKMNLSSFESRSTFGTHQDKLDFERIISLVDESCKEVRNVSHNMMPNALLKKGLSSAVKEFIDKIDHHVLKVNLYSEGLNERVDTNIETVLYRVIQECVNNVITHSQANLLDISLIKDVEGIAVTIEDNGKGFEIDQKIKSEGIGLKNIIARVGYLKGSIDFDSSPGKGTLVAIHVPLVNF